MAFCTDCEGAMLKSMGLTAASANESILASGSTAILSAVSALIRTNAAAPSLSLDALAAVMVPSGSNTGFKPATLSSLSLGYSSSSSTDTNGGTPLPGFLSAARMAQHTFVKTSECIFDHQLVLTSRVGYLDGYDFLGHHACLPGVSRALVGCKGILILSHTGDRVVTRRLLGTLAHVYVVVDVPESVLQQVVLQHTVAVLVPSHTRLPE
mmetsp:Transcript_30682/g.89244  ORF Transcript_30682/g.89244 Transcript_30682/m.89244 type:complete len:210 (+) Transcript_30682:2759-3388(+)